MSEKPRPAKVIQVNGEKFQATFTIYTGYKERASAQREACARGEHKHNPYEDECCPCFGCCVPELAEPDEDPALDDAQTEACARGEHVHNEDDDECCPCLRCCMSKVLPDSLSKDRLT